MEEVEKLSLSTSLPNLIKEIEVHAKFKANLLSSGLVDADYLDSLIEKHNNQNLVFRFIQRLKRANETGAFRKFQQVLKSVGQTAAADTLDAELTEHTRRLRGTEPTQLSEGQPATTAHNVAYLRAAANVPSLEANSTPEDTLSLGPHPPVNYEELKARLRLYLGLRGSRRCVGDVMVPEQYYKDVCRFISKASSTSLPGPLPEIDVTKPNYKHTSLRCISPKASSHLIKTFGGAVSLTYFEDKGRSALRACDSTVKYCAVTVFLNPGNIRKGTTWISVEHTLRETLFDCTSWFQFQTMYYESGKPLDLSTSGGEWYQQTSSMHIKLLRKGEAVGELSKEERRQLLIEHLTAGNEGAALVTHSYACQLIDFAKSASDEEPGPLTGLSDTAAVHNNNSAAHLPMECCALLIDMYGGSVKLMEGTELNCPVLRDINDRIRYVVAELLNPVPGLGEQCLGIYWLSVGCTLLDSIAVALGRSPTRVRTKGEHSDLNLGLRVGEWFRRTTAVRLIVWL